MMNVIRMACISSRSVRTNKNTHTEREKEKDRERYRAGRSSCIYHVLLFLARLGANGRLAFMEVLVVLSVCLSSRKKRIVFTSQFQ